MPRYYFDIHDGVNITDTSGRDLPDRDAAQVEALKVAAEFVAHPKMLGQSGGAIFVVVRDAPDTVLFTVRLVFNVEQNGGDRAVSNDPQAERSQ